MKAIIVAGGKGERLRPLTNTLPKPMIPINGKPVLEHTILLCKKYGIHDFIISLCYLPEKITQYFEDGEKFGVSITYLYEDVNNPLGTAGSIAGAAKYIDSTCIITYADILRELDIMEMIAFHTQKKALVTLHTYKKYDAQPKSKIVFNKTHKITSFIERPVITGKEGSVWKNGSFYICEPGIFDFIQKNASQDFGKDIFPLLLERNKALYAYPTEKYFIDIGDIHKLEHARKTYIPPDA